MVSKLFNRAVLLTKDQTRASDYSQLPPFLPLRTVPRHVTLNLSSPLLDASNLSIARLQTPQTEQETPLYCFAVSTAFQVHVGCSHTCTECSMNPPYPSISPVLPSRLLFSDWSPQAETQENRITTKQFAAKGRAWLRRTDRGGLTVFVESALAASASESDLAFVWSHAGKRGLPNNAYFCSRRDGETGHTVWTPCFVASSSMRTSEEMLRQTAFVREKLEAFNIHNVRVEAVRSTF